MQISPRLKKPLKLTLFTLIPAALVVVVFQNCSDSGLPDNINQKSSSSSGGNALASNDGDNGNGLVPPANSQTCRFFLTSGNYWTVPSDFNDNANTVEVIGSGSDGGGNTRGGGGGGAYAKSVNVSLPAGQQVAYNVAHVTASFGLSGHTTPTSGGDAYLCNSTSNCGSLQGSAVVAGAEGGWSTTNTSPKTYQDSGIDEIGGMGGRAAYSIARGPGSVAYSGGRGGDCYIDCSYNPNSAPGSGGGAAGPHGNGADGGSGIGLGGTADAGYGGKGGSSSAMPGANGMEWDATHGAGGGGGGSAVNIGGARGGNYGGGGGGGGNDGYGTITAADASGIGGGGLIVVTYLGTTCQ